MVATQLVVLPPTANQQDHRHFTRTLPIRLLPQLAHSRLLQPVQREALARTSFKDSLRAQHPQCISHPQLDLTPRQEHTHHQGIVRIKRLLPHSQEHQAFRQAVVIVRLVLPTRRTGQQQAPEDIKQAAVLLQDLALGHRTTRHHLYLNLRRIGTTSPAASTAMDLLSQL